MIPVISENAGFSAEEARELYGDGQVAHLMTPYRLAELEEAIRKALRIPRELVIYTVGRIRGPSMLQRCEMYHVISPLADSSQMLLPVCGIFPHELRDERYD